ncbi:hypothetical protein, partial [Pseudomonas sp.]|uniref:hypothetical protein n=1 Tax=Pseudomonas sp. TaxID=306 RepID=UPI003267AF8C
LGRLEALKIVERVKGIEPLLVVFASKRVCVYVLSVHDAPLIRVSLAQIHGAPRCTVTPTSFWTPPIDDVDLSSTGKLSILIRAALSAVTVADGLFDHLGLRLVIITR